MERRLREYDQGVRRTRWVTTDLTNATRSRVRSKNKLKKVVRSAKQPAGVNQSLEAKSAAALLRTPLKKTKGVARSPGGTPLRPRAPNRVGKVVPGAAPKSPLTAAPKSPACARELC